MKHFLAKISLVALIAAMGLISGCGKTGTESSTPDSSSIADSSIVNSSIVDNSEDESSIDESSEEESSSSESSSEENSSSECEHSGGTATCTEAAICEKCGESYGDIPGHACTSVVFEPTCTEGGCIFNECIVCGYSYVSDEVAALGHTNESVVTAPTCTEDGFTTYTCTVCGVTDVTDIVLAKHSYNENGVCSVCNGEIQTVVPEANKGYIFGMYQGNVQKVYYLKGGMDGYYMATTTNPAEAIYVYIEATEGGYYAYCYENNVKTYINMVVSGTHVNGAYEATASTVYTIDEEHHTLIGVVNGENYWFATRNDKTYTTMGPCNVSFDGFYGEFYDAHIHSYEVGETFAPTCTEEGYTAKECACGAMEKIDIVAALNHIESDWTVETPATCTEAGLEKTVCTRENCGATVSTKEIPATGHTFVEGTCACGAQDPNYEAHEHKYEATVTDPTCTEGGYTTHTCACGDTYTTDEIAALGHTFIDSKCTTCSADYVAPAVGGWALVTELNNGDHVVIGAPAYGKLLSAEKVSASSYYNKGVDYTVEDFSAVTDAEIFAVTVNADGTYTFTSLTGEVIALAASYSSLNKDGEHKSWSLVDKGNGLFLLKNVGRNTYLEWYASKNNWSTYTAGNTAEYELSFYVQQEAPSEEHIHNHISESFANSCTEAGYTTYTCKCGDTYKVDGEAAFGHSYESTVTAPTCTENGYTTYTCVNCNDTYTADEVVTTGHNYVNNICDKCGEEDPAVHKHSYEEVVTAPTCTAKGYTTYTCACGDSYTGNETEMIPHVDTNLDITCDYEGCTKRILPPADSKVSLFTANHMIIVSISNNYYVEGVVTEVTDAKNGVFVITDDAGDTLLVRLPKDADGNLYATWTTFKVVLGDTLQVYGKPTKNSSTPTTVKVKMEGSLITVLKHEHNFSEATCTEDGVCACLAVNETALGHINENEDNLCDRCEWNLNLKISNIVIATDTTLSNGVLAEDQTSWTWSDDNFNAIIAKGSSTFTLYKTAKAFMQLKKQNTFTIENKNGKAIKTVTISTTNATQLTNLEAALANNNLTFTKDADALTITIEWNSTENLTFTNNGTQTAYISGAEIIYE